MGDETIIQKFMKRVEGWVALPWVPSQVEYKRWFSEDSDLGNRVLSCPSFDVLVNAMMSGGQVELSFVSYKSIQEVGSYVAGYGEKEFVVWEHENGARERLLTEREHVDTKKYYVETAHSERWGGNRKDEHEPSWSAVLVYEGHDSKGYQNYSWEERVRVTCKKGVLYAKPLKNK